MVALQVIDPVTQQQSQTTPPTATVSPIMAPAPPPAMGPLTRERRRKAHGLYFHSSPPKVLQMNNQNLQRDNDGRAREVIKPSNIRIWLHQKQLAKLTKVIWTGQGMRLRTETSHHPKMKRFLECVPHVMGVIKDIHQAVVDNDPETLREKMADPTPRIVLTSKDSNGLTPLHKAAGLAHTQIVEYILSIWPSLSSDEDHTGKTPLHWAASAKNNARSFNLLVQAGADEAALDHKGKLAEYYKNKPSDIDRSLLTVIPEAPRISQQGFPSHFDWSMFTIDADTDDSNGSQTRMKPFLSQNNLLDNDVNSNNSVSKSKSVHNLTNGTLTDLANDNDVDADIDAATNDNDDDADADNGGAAEVDGQDQGEKNSNEPPEEEEEPAKVNGDIDADTNEEPDYGADEYDEEADAVAADENKEEQQDSEQATEENVDEKESVEVADAVENGDVDNGAAESVEEGETEEVSHEKADKSSANVVDRETGVALEKTEVNGTGGEEMTDCQEQDKRANEMNEQEVMSDDREIVDDAKVEMVEKIEDDNANEEKNDAKDEAGDTVENGEISKDSLETNPPEQTVPDDIEQDSLNSPTEIQGTEVVNGEIEHINGTGPPSAKSLKSRKSSAALSTKEIENDSRPTTAMRIGSARSIIEDGNGNTRVLTSAKSTKSEIENIENNNEDVILSRPQSVLNDTGSVKSSATSIKSAKSPTKSMGSSRSSAKSKAGSAQSTVSNRINSAVSMKSETNVKASQPEEKILENGIEANGSRPSTANSVKSASTRTRSGTSQTPSASTVRSNHSAQSVVKQRPDTSATKSATSLKSRPKETDDEDDDKSDSNDDSNQADVQIVHIKNSDEELVDDSNQSNGPPTAKMTNDDDQIGSQNETTPSAKTEIDEPIVEPKAIVETQTGTGNGEPDPDKPEDASNNGNTESNNEDGNNNDNGNIPKAESPSTALEIQGTVQGEPDGGQLHSAQPSASDPDQSNAAVPIQEVIDRGDMEQLAVIVLSGSGGKLLGRRADLPEIQAFLDNVPSYMNKIRRVHMAAREGSLRELQSALDRRKFATAKDQISPHGATPLHVATIFGQSGIVRYLAGRFPETMTATDDNGRTPLHYAATLKDNGHFYNLLTHLGANSKAEDNLNHPAEFYLDHEGTKDLLSHRQLLLDYGAEEDLADEMLNDQVPDDQHSARRELDDVDTLTTLERCFKIIHEPVDGVIRKLELPSNSVPGSASSLRILITSYLARFLKRSVFDKIKKRQTRLDHNLFDVIWPAMKKATKERKIDEDLNVGIVIPDYDVFVVFQEFLVPLLKDMHCMDLQQELVPHPQMQYFPRYVIAESPNHTQEGNGNILRENPDDIKLNLDTSGKFITGTVIECSRNLEDYEFPINLSIAQLEKAERILTSKILSMAFAHAIGEEELGTYYTMNEILESPSEIRTILATSGLLIPMLDHFDPYQIAESIALNGRFWPYGRGVYVSHKQDLAAWINAQEHLRVLCCSSSQSPADVGSVYSKIGRVMNFLEDKIQFKHSYFLGYLVSRPSFLGTGLKITLSLELPHLRKERENLRHLCVVRGLHLITEEDETCVRMSNMRSLAQCEWQIFQDYTTAITNIVALEKELSMTNSLHIAATLLKIFQLSNSQVEIPLFRTEEGRYLATSLGDPLIKGLTEVANKRPADPITYLANYLFNFANQNQGQLPATGGNKTSAGADRSADQKQDLNNNRNSIEFGVQEDTEEELESSVNKIGPKPLANGMMAAAKPLDDPEQEQGELSPDIAPSSENRDEHGQSMLHFACARSHGRNALIQLIEESGVSLTYRDELYRTARDVSLQASQPDNAKEIDRYVLGLAARGDLDGLNAMLLDGYDHIVDVAGSDGTTIMQVASTRGHREIVRFLETARDFEEKRETLLTAIREKNSPKVMELLEQPDGAKLAKAKNYYGRCSLHIAVLMENEDLVDFLASRFKSTLKVGDNLERTALHYAMGIGNVEAISRILIKNGAKRVLKDLKGRQPSYYFMNKADILRLQEEEKE
ncbi:uncharacterized protein LOC129741846 isoform X2 [Uranotaenia lowii]|uniref:uncharacterized protein LOC129741846 isoform X2 n=1 Tax=Uranotaenia lowii TaxID=190385 RepID=UPI002478A1C9|nr:uncharacterized protein LOC129741846 isoform X2 [Uranotaenia lowii]